MPDNTCTLPGCDLPLERGGFCYGHYMKNWRYGTPTPNHRRWRDLSGVRFGALVARERVDGKWICDCDCGRETAVLSGDLNRGTIRSCGDRATHCRSDDAGYGAAHARINTEYGAARTHDCVGCGAPARHWSYNHDDADERTESGLNAHPGAYSLDPAHYSPRCVSCHKRFDLGRVNAVGDVFLT